MSLLARLKGMFSRRPPTAEEVAEEEYTKRVQAQNAEIRSQHHDMSQSYEAGRGPRL
jgi:hypothetical protein